MTSNPESSHPPQCGAAALPGTLAFGLGVAASLFLAWPAHAQTCDDGFLAEPGLCLQQVSNYLLTPTVLDYAGASPVVTISGPQWSRDLRGSASGSSTVNFVANTLLFAPAGSQTLTFERVSGGNPALQVAINNTGALGLLAQVWVHNQVGFTNASGATVTIDPAFTSSILSQSSSFLNRGTFLLSSATPPANPFTITTSGAPAAAPVLDNRGSMIAERGAQGFFEQPTTHQDAQIEARSQGQFTFSGATFGGGVTTRTDDSGSAITVRNHTATGDWTHAAGRLEMEDVTFTNGGSRFMNVSANTTVSGPMRGDVAIRNTGSMYVSPTGSIGPSGTGQSQGPAPTIDNDGGAFVIEAGASVEVSEFLNQNGGNTSNRGVLRGPVHSIGGIIQGDGVFVGSMLLEDEAELRPGNSPGHATVDGNLSFLTNSFLELEVVFGPGGEVAYDQLSVQGISFASGAGIRLLVSGTAPADLSSLMLVTCSIGCDFSGAVIDVVGQGGLEFSPAGLTFAVVAVPEPSSWALMLAGLLSLWTMRGRLRRDNRADSSSPTPTWA